MLFSVPMISASPTEKQKRRKKWAGERFSLFFLCHVQREAGELSRAAPLAEEKLWGMSQLLLSHKPTCCQPEFMFLGRAVPGVSPGRAAPEMGVQRDGLCRPGHTLVFCQSSAGSLVGCHKRTIFEELWQCAVNLSHSPRRTHSHWNRHCMDTGNLSAAKAFGYTAPHPLQDLCVPTPWSATALPMQIPFTPCIDRFTPLHSFFSSLPLFLRISGPAVLPF